MSSGPHGPIFLFMHFPVFKYDNICIEQLYSGKILYISKAWTNELEVWKNIYHCGKWERDPGTKSALDGRGMTGKISISVIIVSHWNNFRPLDFILDHGDLFKAYSAKTYGAKYLTRLQELGHAQHPAYTIPAAGKNCVRNKASPSDNDWLKLLQTDKFQNLPDKSTLKLIVKTTVRSENSWFGLTGFKTYFKHSKNCFAPFQGKRSLGIYSQIRIYFKESYLLQ